MMQDLKTSNFCICVFLNKLSFEPPRNSYTVYDDTYHEMLCINYKLLCTFQYNVYSCAF